MLSKKSVLRICPVCHDIFDSSLTGSHKYCSLFCRKVAQKEKQAKWQLAHPTYWRDLMRVRREAAREEKQRKSEV